MNISRIPLLIIPLVLMVALNSNLSIQSQEATPTPTPPTVPDLSGLSVPQAAAQLNQIGLLLGEQSEQTTPDNAEQLPNTVIGQSLEAGTTASEGDTVNIVVFREHNTTILFDDNDITLINSGDAGNIWPHTLEFIAVDGETALPGTIWEFSEGYLLPGRCVQFWTVSRTSGEVRPPCQSLLRFEVENDRQYQVWTGTDGATQFAIVQDGIQRGTCETYSGFGLDQCELYVSPGRIPQDSIEYIYLQYTEDYLLVVNRSSDRWVPTTRLQTNTGFTLGDRENFSNISETIGNVELLAPGQCLLFTRSGATVDATLLSCNIIAQATLDADAVFWSRPFQFIRHQPTGEDPITPRDCPAVLPDETMVCILPR